jgi:hypothetical protein
VHPFLYSPGAPNHHAGLPPASPDRPAPGWCGLGHAAWPSWVWAAQPGRRGALSRLRGPPVAALQGSSRRTNPATMASSEDEDEEGGMNDMWDPLNSKPYDMWDPLTELKLSSIPYFIPPTKQKNGSEPIQSNISNETCERVGANPIQHFQRNM